MDQQLRTRAKRASVHHYYTMTNPLLYRSPSPKKKIENGKDQSIIQQNDVNK